MQTISSPGYDASLMKSCFQTIAHLIPLSAGVFYLVNPQLRPQNYILHNVDDSTHRLYLSHFQHLDPMLPRYFDAQDIHMIDISAVRARQNHRHYYHDFMLPNGMHDMMEIFIRQQKRIVAAVSLMRDTPFTDHERTRLRAAIPLIELAARDLMPQSPPSGLTAKEQEIVIQVRAGASNKRIALNLGISLSTVKTHMRNIFAKTQVTNRTELASGHFYCP